MSDTHNIFLGSTIVVFDLETTGTDLTNDRIVSMALSFLYPDGKRVDKYTLVNPGIPIPKAASEVHKITDEMVKDAPRFSQLAKALHAQMTHVDLAGFNITNFDIPFLAEEFARCQLEWPLNIGNVYDGCGIFKNMERKRLSDAMKFYCGKEIEDAHNAAADVDATIQVLGAQIERYGWKTRSEVELASCGSWEGEELVMNTNYDPAGKLYVDADGDVCYNFGKSKDCKVKAERGFGEWMLKQDFIPSVTKRMLSNYMRTWKA